MVVRSILITAFSRPPTLPIHSRPHSTESSPPPPSSLPSPFILPPICIYLIESPPPFPEFFPSPCPTTPPRFPRSVPLISLSLYILFSAVHSRIEQKKKKKKTKSKLGPLSLIFPSIYLLASRYTLPFISALILPPPPQPHTHTLPCLLLRHHIHPLRLLSGCINLQSKYSKAKRTKPKRITVR